MEIISICATFLSAIIYITFGFTIARHARTLEDHVPVSVGRLARVGHAKEFSASTVGAVTSLATVILAFFELAPHFGLWLFWTVITTMLGLLVVRILAARIWSKMAAYGSRRPTLHEFLGTEYGSSSVALIGASCTSLGFLGAFAVELTVGSRFLALLIPSINPFALLIALAAVGLTYTAAGGFRAVVLTDLIQIKAIWFMLMALLTLYISHFVDQGSFDVRFQNTPSLFTSPARFDELLAFIIGIFLINVPTYLSDMSIWQRIAGSQSSVIVLRGLWRSASGVAVVWTAFILLATLVPVIAVVVPNENSLFTVLVTLSQDRFNLRFGMLFLVVFGMYAAMFSTASTQLIAVSQTVYVDLVSKFFTRKPSYAQLEMKKLRDSRIIIVAVAILAIFVVELMNAAAFSIADLVFAIYGAQLSLFPPTFLALFMRRDELTALAPSTAKAMACGFIGCWGAAAYGKAIGSSVLVFLAPAASLLITFFVLGCGFLMMRRSKKSNSGYKRQRANRN